MFRIAENAYRYMERSIEPEEATILGTREVTIPVIAGVTTTIAAFLPLMLTSGVMGEFLKMVPVAGMPKSGRDEGRISVELPISGAVTKVMGG